MDGDIEPAAPASRARDLSRKIGAFLLLWAALCLPAVVTGRTLVFPDTRAYLRVGEVIFSSAHRPAADAAPVGAATNAPASAAEAEESPQEKGLVLGGRSGFYGAWLFLTAAPFGFLGAALLQGLAVAWILWTATGLVLGRGRLVVGLACVLGGAIPLYVGFMMPDVFGGLGCLALCTFLLFGERARWRDRIALLALVLAAALFHAANLLLDLVLVGALLPAVVVARRWERSVLLRFAVAAAVLMTAVAAQSAYLAAASYRLGAPIRSPPFLAARVAADGPGRAYLEEACPKGLKLALCAFRDRGFATSDEFLWSRDPQRGVVMTADYATRLRISREEPAFVLGAVGRHPLWQAGVSARNFGLQLVRFGAGEASRDRRLLLLRPDWTDVTRRLPGGGACVAKGSCGAIVPPAAVDPWLWAAVIASLGTLAALARPLAREDRRTAILVLALLFAVAANAAICGVLSSPNERYQGRLIWLVVFAAAVAALRVDGRRPWLERLRRLH